MKERALITRVILNLTLLISVLFLPWWVSIFFAVVLLVFFEAWEIMVWGVVFDALYSSPAPISFGGEFVFTILFVSFFVVAGILKKRLIFY